MGLEPTTSSLGSHATYLLSFLALWVEKNDAYKLLAMGPVFIWHISGMLVSRIWDSYPVEVPDPIWIRGLRMIAFGYIALFIMVIFTMALAPRLIFLLR